MIVIRSKKVRGALRWALPLLIIPAAVALGSLLPGKYALLSSLIVAVLSLLLFLAGFERRVTGERRLVIVAVMTALCVVGRFIPFFKPITALTVITALYFGGEAGFLTGAMAAAISNFYFGQGPWTPFQMLAWGLIGLFAGCIAGPMKRHRWMLLVYGVLAGAAYSLVMDVWTVLWYDGGMNWSLYGAAVLTALPHTLLYAVSNFVFLWFLAKPIGEKLERICVKYGV